MSDEVGKPPHTDNVTSTRIVSVLPSAFLGLVQNLVVVLSVQIGYLVVFFPLHMLHQGVFGMPVTLLFVPFLVLSHNISLLGDI